MTILLMGLMIFVASLGATTQIKSKKTRSVEASQIALLQAQLDAQKKAQEELKKERDQLQAKQDKDKENGICADGTVGPWH